MTVGIPGVGLGGIFYLVSAMLMPVHQLGRVLRGRESARWPLVRRQCAIACAILGALWLTGWALGLLVAAMPRSVLGAAHASLATPHVHNLLRTGALVLSLGTLALVLVLVQICRLVVRRAPAPRHGRAIADIGAGRATMAGEADRGSETRVDSGTFRRAR